MAKKTQTSISQVRIQENEYTRFNNVVESLDDLMMSIALSDKGRQSVGLSEDEEDILLSAVSILSKTRDNMRRDLLQVTSKLMRQL